MRTLPLQIWRAPWEESKAKSSDLYHLERRSYVRFNLVGSSNQVDHRRNSMQGFESLLELLICLCIRVLRRVRGSAQSEKVSVNRGTFRKELPSSVLKFDFEQTMRMKPLLQKQLQVFTDSKLVTFSSWTHFKRLGEWASESSGFENSLFYLARCLL